MDYFTFTLIKAFFGNVEAYNNCLSLGNLSIFPTVLKFEGTDRGAITHLLYYNWPMAKLSPV